MEYQKLFDHMLNEHGLTLLQSEMQEIIEVVRKIDGDGWISVEDKLPEELDYLSDKRIPDLERTKTLLVYTDMGSMLDNSRVKKKVDQKEWVWLMDIEGEIITHYKEAPSTPKN